MEGSGQAASHRPAHKHGMAPCPAALLGRARRGTSRGHHSCGVAVCGGGGVAVEVNSVGQEQPEGKRRKGGTWDMVIERRHLVLEPKCMSRCHTTRLNSAGRLQDNKTLQKVCVRQQGVCTPPVAHTGVYYLCEKILCLSTNLRSSASYWRRHLFPACKLRWT